MKRIFDLDNPFNAIMTKIFDLMLLNILWFLCCIPVITAGASTTALYYVILKMVRNEEGAIMRSFFGALRDNFSQSVPITLILGGCIAVLTADLHILGGGNDGTAAVMYGGCITLAIIAVGIFSYVFPLLARFDNTVKNTFVNAGKLAVSRLPLTVIMTVLNALPFLWFLLSPETFALVFWIWFFIGTGVVVFLDSCLLLPVFDKLQD